MTFTVSREDGKDIHWLYLPHPKPLLNENDRQGWRAKNRLVQQIKTDTHWLAKAAKLPVGCSFADIRLVYFPPDRRRRDDHNMGPTLKAAVDGLVAYGLVADDDSTHVSSRCEIRSVHKPALVALRIEVTL